MTRSPARVGRALAWLGTVGATAVAAGCGSGPPEALPVDVGQHEAMVAHFQEARVAELEAPDSWLSLVGLYWLEDGSVTMGSDPSNDIVLPAGKAAPRVGRIVREGDEVRFVAEPGVRVTSGIDSTLALSAGSGAFPPDVSGDPAITDEALGSAGPGKSIVHRHGPINWITMESQGRVALRVRDNASPNYDTFHGIDRFPTSEAWRVTARWVPQEKEILVPDVLGGSSEAVSPAYVEFWIDGERHTLDVTGEPGAARYMMVFADASSGDDTYGGGRYMWFDAPDAEGRVVLDFNLAYNPPCVWTDFAVCPLPSRENRLTVAVGAGEKRWAH